MLQFEVVDSGEMICGYSAVPSRTTGASSGCSSTSQQMSIHKTAAAATMFLAGQQSRQAGRQKANVILGGIIIWMLECHWKQQNYCCGQRWSVCADGWMWSFVVKRFRVVFNTMHVWSYNWCSINYLGLVGRPLTNANIIIM